MHITDVEKGSIGEELGIAANDELIGFNGNKAEDILDYDFYNESESFVMSVLHNGEVIDYEIEKDVDEDMGLVFDEEIKTRVCRNKCIFCFVDQLPKKELRTTLRVKDDDYRFSFISGSYVTLTNLSESDLQRIIRLKLSPLYVSVHTSDNKLRRYMLGNSAAPDICEQLRLLHDGGIKLHAQIVYCPCVNEDVAKTAKDIAPFCETLAVVPVGLTKDCNTALKPVSKADAERIIDVVEPLQEEFLKQKHTRFIFIADEFYIRAGRDVPDFCNYEDFSQLENGIGLIALFRHDFEEALAITDDMQVGECSIATGVDAYPTIREAAKKLTDKFGGEIKVHKIHNEFFGDSVTVAGLVTGGDILKQLAGKSLGERLIIPRCMLKEFKDVFLDNMSVKELSSKLGVKIKIIDADGFSFVKGCSKNEC